MITMMSIMSIMPMIQIMTKLIMLPPLTEVQRGRSSRAAPGCVVLVTVITHQGCQVEDLLLAVLAVPLDIRGLGGGALVLVHWLRRHRHLPPTGNRFPQALQTLWRWMASSMIDPCRSHQLNANAATLRRRHRPPALNMAQHRRTPWADSSFQVIAWFVCARFVCAPCALSRSDMGGSSTGPMRTRGLAASSGHPSGPRRAVWPA